MRPITAAAVAAVLACAPVAPALAASGQPAAAAPTKEEAAEIARIKGVLASLKPRTGAITVEKADAALQLSDKYYFLDAADAKKVLVDLWGNRPEEQDDVLGMIMPAGVTAYDASWGAVVTYLGDGYVSDKDAKKTDYDKLLKDMQEAAEQANDARKQAGYAPMHVVGWAEAPRYDGARHNLVWARDLKAEDHEGHTLNYDVRLLGRKGVLSLNIVAGMADLPAVRQVAAGVQQTAVFKPGFRYKDYHFGDQRAAYGVAGLVAAGVGVAAAKKAGLLAVLFIALKKFGVIIAAGAASAFAWLKRTLGVGGRKDSSDVPPPSA